MGSKPLFAAGWFVTLAFASVAHAAPPPDLTIDSFTVEVTQTTVLYSVTVCNISKNGPSSASSLGLYYDRSTAPGCTTTPSHTWAIPALQTETCSTQTHTRSSTPLGAYRSWVLADSSCVIKEASETNNTASEQFLVIRELRVVDFTASVGSDRSVTFEATIANDGIAFSTPFEVGLYYDRASAPDCNDSADGVWPLSGLAHDESATQSSTRTSVAAGVYRAWIYADRTCVVDENDEDNNSRSVYYVVGPNITLSNVQASATASTVTYQVTVCNEGSEQTGAFDVALWFDRSSTPSCSSSGASHTWSQSDLAPGECATLTRSRAGVVSGNYTAQVLADADCVVGEANEEDNSVNQGYSVAGHDLYVASFTTTVQNKTSIRYEASVCNSGAAVTQSFAVGIFYDQPTQPGCSSATPSYQSALAGLAQGACETVSVTEEGLSPGQRLAWVVVDSACDVVEDSESNNSQSSPVTIASWPELSVTEVTADVQGRTLRVYATICSNGTAGAPPSTGGFYLQRDEPPPPDCSAVPHESQELAALEIGTCTNQAWLIEGVADGRYTSYVTADVDCAIDELDETNNSAAITFTVGEAVDDDAGVADAGAEDAGVADAGASDDQTTPASDADGGTVEGGSGCSCEVSGEPPAALLLLLVLFLFTTVRARTRSRRRF